MTQVWLAVSGLSPGTLTQVSPETIHTLPVFEGGNHGCTSKAVAKSTTTKKHHKICYHLSKAVAKSPPPPIFLKSFIRESHWSTRLAKAVWRGWFSLNPDWLEWSRLFLLKCARMCLFMCFSKGFERADKTETGLQFDGSELFPDLKRGMTLACLKAAGT